MNRLSALAAALCLAATPLAGCANLPTIGLVPAGSSAPHTTQTKTFLAAEDGIEGVAALVEQAIDQGYLKGDNAAKAAELLKTLKAVDNAAYAAYQNGNTAGGDTLTASIFPLITQLQALVAVAKHGAN